MMINDCDDYDYAFINYKVVIQVFIVHTISMLCKIQPDVMKIIYDLFMATFIVHSCVVCHGFIAVVFLCALLFS